MKQLLIKIITFLFLLTIFQTIISLSLPQLVPVPPLIKHAENIKSISPDIVFFGDSTISFTDPSDIDERSIPAMLQPNLPQNSIMLLNHDGFDVNVYREFTGMLIPEADIKYLIIPINLRSFSSKWETTTAFQFPELKTYLRTYNTPVYSVLPFSENFQFFKLLPSPQTDAFYDSFVENEIAKLKSDKSSESYIKQALLTDYMYKINSDNRKLKSIIEIAELANKTNTIPIFYITPIDYQFAQEYYPDFSNNLAFNINIISQSLIGKKACFLDLSVNLKTNYFAWRHSGLVNEHLNQYGRNYLAKTLEKTLSSLETNPLQSNCMLIK